MKTAIILRLNWLGLILAWLAAGHAAAAGDLAFADDLQSLTRANRPLVIVYTAPGCGYCERVMHEYLIPLQDDPAYRDRISVRRLESGRDDPLKDFAGRATTQDRFITAQRIQLYPTVQVYGPRGEVLAPPLVGLSSPDFYGAYLDARLAVALGKLKTGQGGASTGPRE